MAIDSEELLKTTQKREEVVGKVCKKTNDVAVSGSIAFLASSAVFIYIPFISHNPQTGLFIFHPDFLKMLNYRANAMLSLILVITLHNHDLVAGQLRVGFYDETCPDAESIVFSVVQQAVRREARNVPILLRLHFHDCFVEGCDGSILINRGSERDERTAIGHQGVGGFEVVDEAKAQLEDVCPGVVSCADIVALMARDAVFLGKGSFYDVPTGRRDGLVSNVNLAANMPEVDDSIGLFKSKFRSKGLSDQDLVLLNAAHSIGTTACFFMEQRLYNFTGNHDSDPAINSAFLQKLKAECPLAGDENKRIFLDQVTDSVLDDQILRNIRNGFAVIASDARLYDDARTRQIIDSYIGPSKNSSPSFLQDFNAAIVRMGRIGVKTAASQGEIRRVCSQFNS